MGAATGLFCFPPERYSFWPQCPFHQLTGLRCPGCGATRALAALLHGHLRGALHFNALVILLLPVAGFYGLTVCLRALRGHPHPWPRIAPQQVGALLAVAAAFAVLRNLP